MKCMYMEDHYTKVASCYGSDEEQARTTAVDVAEQKCHIPMLLQNEREVEERKNTETDLHGSP